MQKPEVNIIWFRNNLRINDNITIHQALKQKIPVIGLYCFESQLYRTYFYDIPKTNNYRARFTIEAVKNLKSKLDTLNIALKVSLQKTEEAIYSINKRFAVKGVYFQKEWTSEEKKVENKLKNTFKHIDFYDFFDQFLFHPDDIPYDNYHKISQVFTNFRKKCEKFSIVRDPLPVPEPQAQSFYFKFNSKLPKLEDLGLTNFCVHPNTAFPFQGGETSVMKRLTYYFWETKKLMYYKKTRNGLLGTDYSSKFSPWLAQGSISARCIYKHVKQFENNIKKNQDTYWLIFELIWRDYFKYISLKYGNKIFKQEGILDKKYSWKSEKKVFYSWINGKTNDNFVNANMLELKQTGFMSNRGRQNVSSYWSKILQQDWRIGAAYFESMLIDYDVHSNWGNWMYNSGIGNDPRDRIFNTQIQANRYDKNGKYRRTWLEQTLF